MSELSQNGSVIRFDPEVLPVMEPRLFDIGWLRANGHLEGASAGRGEAHFLVFEGRPMVLRHFRRGGLIGRVNPDLYFRLGTGASRAMREFDLLAWMQEEGLPVPRPVAARYGPRGVFYRADIITERLPDARPLEEALCDAALPASVWSTIGATLRRFHDKGVFHADLNCRNILLDDRKDVWLIDFDKSRRRPQGGWKEGNLKRLLRSLCKARGLHTDFHWSEQDWRDLLSAYGNPAVADRAEG